MPTRTRRPWLHSDAVIHIPEHATGADEIRQHNQMDFHLYLFKKYASLSFCSSKQSARLPEVSLRVSVRHV